MLVTPNKRSFSGPFWGVFFQGKEAGARTVPREEAALFFLL